MIAGLQLYTLREFCKAPQDIVDSLKRVKEIGYQFVQVSGVGPIDTKELKKILDDLGIQAPTTHQDYNRIIEETEEVIEEHKILSAPYVVCPGLPRELHNAEGYKKVAEEFNKVGEIMKKEGLTLLYHNHGIEFEKYDKKLGLEILFEHADPDILGMEIDTYWVQYGGGDPAYWIERFSNKMPICHLKDMGIKDNQQVMMPIGEGNLNWPAIVKACEKAGVIYAMVELDQSPLYPIWDAIKISLEHMLSWGLTTK
ncbi:MAG TPA: sugar phosphate isomerase/epimerase [Candidatus Atribacteria bacterium]|nr:sugar phosphate isomerase/epimerase [Candidatus Atribacteria bacterium]